LFEQLGEFFRQYFFAMDREEMPFNRAERSWVYRAAKGVDNTVAFGSTRDLRPVGTVLFVNTPFPILDEAREPVSEITIGRECSQPYTTSALINISAMSFGALSKPAIEALSRGAAKAGVWLNTGEGGLSEAHLAGNADIVFQIGTAKYGVRTPEGKLDERKLAAIAARDQVKMFEIKISQGAKPGKGGIVPGVKVTPEVAEVRGIPVGKDSISPNRHRELVTSEDLLDMIARIREVTGKPVGFKVVLGMSGWVTDLFRRVVERDCHGAPDFITVDGGEGGTGAAPMPLMDNVGMSIRESLPFLVDELTRAGLKDRVKVIASGKLITPVDVAWALCTGADFVNTARGSMFALGCVQAMQCNKNTCPTGITTHEPDLQKGLDPIEKGGRVAGYFSQLVREVEIIAHSVGVREPRKLRRHHARIMTQDGRSRPLSELWPYVDEQ
ncbi:MAG: FMN-binding glutamate synthase family protein, partial [Pseudomonadota bacterium]|nr:FMN-binding glutamate synthase family protein [Pseudomonadota bacterium]